MAVLLKLPGEVIIQDSALPQGRPDGNLHITVGKYRPGRAQLNREQATRLFDALAEWLYGDSQDVIL